MADSLLEHLQHRLKEDIASCEHHLSGGGAKDYAAYKETVGRVQAYRTALGYVDDVIKRIVNHEDEDDE